MRVQLHINLIDEKTNFEDKHVCAHVCAHACVETVTGFNF